MPHRRASALAVWAALLFLGGAASAQNSLIPAATVAAKPVVASTPTAAVPPPVSWKDQDRLLATLAGAANHNGQDSALAVLEAKAAAIQAQARAAVATASQAQAKAAPDLKRLRARARRHPDARTPLAAAEGRDTLLRAQISAASHTAARAADAVNAIAQIRRNDFTNRVLRRYASPLSPAFWRALNTSGYGDLDRFADMAEEAQKSATQAIEPTGAIGLALGALAALLLCFPIRLLAIRLAVGHRPQRRHWPLTVQRLWIGLVDFGLPSLGAVALRAGAAWGGLLSSKADALAGSAVVAVAWGAAIVALGRALGAGRSAERRIVKLSDREAAKARLWLMWVAVVTAFGFVLTRLVFLSGGSVASGVAAQAVVALAYVLVAGGIVFSLRAQDVSASDATPAPLRGLFSMGLAAAIFATVVCLLSGYITLGALISGQVFWLSLVGAAAFLLLRVIDDLIGVGFGRGGWARRTLASLFRLSSSTVAQIGILAAAGMQLLVLIGALALALTPFGQSGDLLLGHLGRIGEPLRFGTATLSLPAIATGVGCLAIGVTLARFVRDWVVRRYLPATTWDTGVRNSVGTGVGYLGVGVALLAALAAMGLGLQQIALIASALSVGIGFGLQQIVQNFVAGIILLVERPVKVGDWVKVDDVEGDVMRIRVRATEVQTFDHSTVIVPNSDFVTKAVRNRTLGQSRGRVQLQVAIANPGEARRACDLIAKAASSDAEVLDKPRPSVFVDSVAPGAINLNCYLYVADPGEAYEIRSRLYLAAIEALCEAHIGLAAK